ncbi:MAG: hypothetical protein WA738_01240, partial [Candidatus Angelobacter sp.]
FIIIGIICCLHNRQAMRTLLLIPWLLKWPIVAEEAFVVLLALGSLLAVGRKLWRFFQPNRRLKHGIERLGYHFRTKNTVHIFGLYTELPTIEPKGRFALTEEEKLIQRTLPVPEENDPHAILVTEPDWTQPKPHFEVQGLEYHELKALRSAGKLANRAGVRVHRTARVVSANAVIICRQNRQLILHYRSANSASYPLCYHTIGGGYMPPGIHAKDDLDSLENTLAREVNEEARIKLSLEKIPQLLIMEEVETGFIQVAFLGIDIPAAQADHLPDNPRPIEGRPVRVPFDKLHDLLSRPDWVPTGKAAVLAWLALGAPAAGPYPRFGRNTAAGLCEEILATSHVELTVAAMSQTGR